MTKHRFDLTPARCRIILEMSKFVELNISDDIKELAKTDILSDDPTIQRMIDFRFDFQCFNRIDLLEKVRLAASLVNKKVYFSTSWQFSEYVKTIKEFERFTSPVSGDNYMNIRNDVLIGDINSIDKFIPAVRLVNSVRYMEPLYFRVLDSGMNTVAHNALLNSDNEEMTKFFFKYVE